MPGHIIERPTARNRLAELGRLRCFQCHGTISGPTDYDVVFRVASGRIAIIVSQVPRVGRLTNIFSRLLQIVMLPGITRDAHNCEKGRIGVRNVGYNITPLCRTYALRAYDAVQLAALLSLRDETVAASAPPPIFVCADIDLLGYAAAEGLAVEDPNSYP